MTPEDLRLSAAYFDANDLPRVAEAFRRAAERLEERAGQIEMEFDSDREEFSSEQ